MEAGGTIVAVASPPGEGARGVLRVSGPLAFELLARTFHGEDAAPERARRAVLRGRFDDGRGTQPALVLWMPGPASYTREDVFELHLVAAPPLLAAALERLCELGARPAQRGEFTRRAFLSGRLDLSRAEGVLALVEASGLAEARAGAALLGGGLGRRVADLRGRLEDLRALAEASLDFDESETGHVPDEELLAQGAAARAALVETAAWEEQRVRAAGQPRVVLAGRPNAGKSALFNALCGPDQALESELAGSTRDVLAARWSVAGVPVVLVDTAGLSEEQRGPDGRAQELGRAQRAAADLVLWLVDSSGADPLGAAREARGGPGDPPRLLVWSQIDRVAGASPAAPGTDPGRGPGDPLGAVATSARTGAGLAELERAAAQALGFAPPAGAGAAAPGAGTGARELDARHRAALGEALAELDRALELRSRGAPLDLFAEALRGATRALDRIAGRTGIEDLLDRIFARFCIGK